MNRTQLIRRVRNTTRDLLGTTFREMDIVDFLDEAVDRVRQVIPEFRMSYLTSNDMSPTHLPESYHSLLATYASASLYFQDDRHHQATVKMNEFETKLAELKASFYAGDVEIVDGAGAPVYADSHAEYVKNAYFEVRGRNVDTGVEGVDY